MNEEQYRDILECLSKERLYSYRQNSEDTVPEVIDNYIYNLLENQKLYPPLHILEVVFRNRSHASISTPFNNPNWILAYLQESDQNIKIKLKKIGPKSLEEFNKNVLKAYRAARETALSQERKVIEGDLIANLTFGFWSSLYMHIFSNILSNKGLFILTFKNFQFNKLGSDKYLLEEQNIRKCMDDIRKKRNRIFHYDKINNHMALEREIYKIIFYLSGHCHEFFKQKFNK